MLTDEVQARNSLFRQSLIDRTHFLAVCSSALAQMHKYPFGPQVDYLDFHQQRFYELDNIAASVLRENRGATLLDVGMSVNTLVLQNLFPALEISVVDRMDIAPASVAPFRLFNVDLCDIELDALSLPGLFDVIVFAEVLEHLLANPVRVLNFLIRHLTPDGALIITTPNFFAAQNLRGIANRENPQPVFPKGLKRGEENQFHVREYSMSELLEFAMEAGGRPVAFFYSSCWEADPSKVPEEEWQNLCAIIKRAA